MSHLGMILKIQVGQDAGPPMAQNVIHGKSMRKYGIIF